MEIPQPLVSQNFVEGSSKRANEFSSENHKLEILNLPGHTKYYIVQQMLEKHFKLNAHKVKIGDRRAYVTFTSEGERDKAIEKINNQEWKGRKLIARPSVARQDPFLKKSHQENPENPSSCNQDKRPTSGEDLNDQVCPLWRESYDEQLRMKDELMRNVLNIGKRLKKICPSLRRDAPKLSEWFEHSSPICCQYDGVEPSPTLYGYRNKCEFNIGRCGTVGFRLGRYRDGSEVVVSPPSNCPIVNQTMFRIIQTFQSFLQDPEKTSLRGFDQVTHEGNLRQLTVRTNEERKCLLIVDLHRQSMTDEELEKELKSIVSLYDTDLDVVSLYVNISEKGFRSGADQTLKLLHGHNYLNEKLVIHQNRSLKFRIGPNSFFQVNTKAAEVLYRSIIDLAEITPTSFVLDVGCGTGTIGISLASMVSYVIGIEVVESAITDAKVNAAQNDTSNISFFVGRAEELIGECISILKTKQKDQSEKGDIVAIVDPPRTGFNNSFIKTIRASNIKKIIYVACDPNANTNLTSLCRPTSKAYQGDPFVPTRAKAFDLFPHTKFCELVLVYERLSHENCVQHQADKA